MPRSAVWRSLPESQMCAILVVVANILREQASQVTFVNCDDVIQEITPATPYPTLCDSILPRTSERGADRTHHQGSTRCGHFQSILGITIKDDEPPERIQMETLLATAGRSTSLSDAW